MKKCIDCDLTYGDNKKFCKKCGKPLEAAKGSDIEINSKKEVFEDKLKAEPQNTGLLIEFSKFLIEYELINEALPVLYKVQAIDPKNEAFEKMLLQCYIKQNNTDKALQIGKEILSKRPADKDALALVSDIEFKKENFAECLVYADKIIQLEPDNFEALKKKAQILFKTGKEQESFELWKKVYAIDNSDLSACMYTGIDACENSEYKKAEKLLLTVVDKIKDKSPEKKLATIYLAFAMTGLKTDGNKVENVVKDYLSQDKIEEIEREKTGNALSEVCFYIGNMYAKKASYNVAIECFEKAKSLGKKEESEKLIGSAFFNISKDCLKQKDLNSAIKYVKDAIEHCPQNTEFKYSLEDINKQQNNKKQKSRIYTLIFLLLIALGYAGWHFAHGDLTIKVEPKCRMILKKRSEILKEDSSKITLTSKKMFFGKYIIELKDAEGYADSTIKVKIGFTGNKNIFIKLRQLFGSLKVNSKPEGWNVYVNGSLKGNTPILINKIPAKRTFVMLRSNNKIMYQSGVEINFNQETDLGTIKPEPTWEKTYGGPKRDEGRCIQQTSDGGFIIIGNTSSFGSGESDVYLVRIDNNGEKKWAKTFGGIKYDWAGSVQQTNDGGFILAGATHSFGAGMEDVYLIRTDGNGKKYGLKPLVALRVIGRVLYNKQVTVDLF